MCIVVYIEPSNQAILFRNKCTLAIGVLGVLVSISGILSHLQETIGRTRPIAVPCLLSPSAVPILLGIAVLVTRRRYFVVCMRGVRDMHADKRTDRQTDIPRYANRNTSPPPRGQTNDVRYD